MNMFQKFTLILLLAPLLLSACGPGQLFGPTLTPTPIKPVPTQTPTATEPAPMQTATATLPGPTQTLTPTPTATAPHK